MIIQFSLLLVVIHCFSVLSFSANNSNSIFNSSVSPSISATILDHNNRDITSSFQILLYSQLHPTTPFPNSTFPPHQPRRVLNRLLNECPNHEQFISSHCNPLDGAPGSLQAYTLVCRGITPGGRRRPINRHQLYCENEEICVDTVSQVTYRNTRSRGGDSRIVTAPTATCITDDLFEPSPDVDAQTVAGFWAAVVGLGGDAPGLVRAAISRVDRNTPMEVDRLVIEGRSRVEEQRAVCRDCVGMGMKVNGGLEKLRLEARLLTGVQAGMTGILWVAAMSG